MRLTENDSSGNWRLKGVKWNQLYIGQTITKELQEKLFLALYKLMEYENTGLDPERAWELKEKAEPQKARKVPLAVIDEEYECPNCRAGLTKKDVFAGYCKWCGQKIEEENNEK